MEIVDKLKNINVQSIKELAIKIIIVCIAYIVIVVTTRIIMAIIDIRERDKNKEFKDE